VRIVKPVSLAVKKRVNATGNDEQVFRTIIVVVPVDVMDDVFTLKSDNDSILNDLTMGL
jgi:hypothetical protein